MNDIKPKEFFKKNGFWILVIVFFVILHLNYKKGVIDMDKYGVVTSVTVENYYQRSDRGGVSRMVSAGNYYVHGVAYSCFSKKLLPIGSKFRIKYNSQKPQRWQIMEE